MKRFWGHITAATITACIGGVVLPACAHDDSSIYVAQVVTPPLATPQGCIYATPTTAVPGLFSGTLDVGIASAYSPVVLIGNQLLARGDQTTNRTETNRVQIRGAVVRVTDSQGNQLSNFTALSEGVVVDPEIGTTPGLNLVQLTIIDPDTVKSFKGNLTVRTARKQLVTYFKVFGQTLGGTYVETGEFQYVVEACNGCLVDFPADATDPNQPTPNCLGSIPTGGVTASLPCVIGQDQRVDCRLCQGADACDPTKLR